MTIMLPTDFSARPPTTSDLDAIAKLFVSRETFFMGAAESTIESSKEWISSVWQSQDFTIANDGMAVFTPEGQCIGYVTVWHPEQEPAEMYASPGVDPAYFGLGIGTYLLRWAQWRANQVAAVLPTDKPVYFRSWAQGTDKAAPAILTQAGLAPLRYFWRMEKNLTAPVPLPTLPAGITIREFIPGQDEYATFQATDEAFKDHWGYLEQSFEEWSRWTLQSSSFDPSLWFLATSGQQIVGTALGRIDEGEDARIGWISDLGVLRPWRKQGIALALLQHAFHTFQVRGLTKCGLSVDSENLTGATRLYERAGMHKAEKYEVLYEKVLRAAM